MMNIEQTSQLLQLILNSVLLSGVCAAVLGMVLWREQGLRSHLLRLNAIDIDMTSADRRRKQRHDVRRWHRYEHHNLSLSYGALLSSLLSCFLLAGRSLMNWNGLIIGGLALFGVSILGVLCVVWRLLWWSVRWSSAVGVVRRSGTTPSPSSIEIRQPVRSATERPDRQDTLNCPQPPRRQPRFRQRSRRLMARPPNRPTVSHFDRALKL